MSANKAQHSYVYVPESEYGPVKKQLLQLIDTVQKSIKNKMKFRIKFIGSSSRNMITKDLKGNSGYDFDLNIIIDPNTVKDEPKVIKDFFRNAFDKYVKQFGYDNCEDSTSVFTIKTKDNGKIIHSADFGIVRKYYGEKQILMNHKDLETYCWENLPKYSKKVSKMADWCKEKGLWEEVRDRYIRNKNENTDPGKKSRMIYADTVNQVFLKNGGDPFHYSIY